MNRKKIFCMSFIFFCFLMVNPVFAREITLEDKTAEMQKTMANGTQEELSDTALLQKENEMIKKQGLHYTDIEVDHEISPKDYIPVLMYHHFVDGTVPDGNGATVSIQEFEEHIKTFQQEGYTLISLEELYHIMSEAANEQENDRTITKKELHLPKKYLCITIDDGYLSNYQLAYPILKKYQAKADISVITSRIHSSHVTMPEIEKLTWQELNEMQQSGLVHIYNHTSDHRTFSEDSIMQFRSSVEMAEQLLQERLTEKSPIQVLTYPNGNYSLRSQILFRQMGYDLQLTTDFGVVNGAGSVNRIPRITVNSGLTGHQVMDKMIAAAERTFYPQ